MKVRQLPPDYAQLLVGVSMIPDLPYPGNRVEVELNDKGNK